jgi:hypothetical protein
MDILPHCSRQHGADNNTTTRIQNGTVQNSTVQCSIVVLDHNIVSRF